MTEEQIVELSKLLRREAGRAFQAQIEFPRATPESHPSRHHDLKFEDVIRTFLNQIEQQ